MWTHSISVASFPVHVKLVIPPTLPWPKPRAVLLTVNAVLCGESWCCWMDSDVMVPCVGYPTICLHATLASTSSHPSSHTVLQSPSTHTSTRPSVKFWLCGASCNLMAPSSAVPLVPFSHLACVPVWSEGRDPGVVSVCV